MIIRLTQFKFVSMNIDFRPFPQRFLSRKKLFVGAGLFLTVIKVLFVFRCLSGSL